MSLRFHYTKFPRGVYFPVLDISVADPHGGNPGFIYKVIVDSGASGCIFHAGIGESIGLDIKSGRKLPLLGVTEGKGEQYLHQVIIDIEGRLKILSEVGFSYDLNFPFGLLGEREFFDVFRICFDLSRKEFELFPKYRQSKKWTTSD